MTAEQAETTAEKPKMTPEEAIESLNKALETYYEVSGWADGVLSESVVVSAQQIFTESGHARTQVYVLPLGAIPPYRIIGLLDYARMFYDAEVVAAHMPPPMVIHQLPFNFDAEGDDE